MRCHEGFKLKAAPGSLKPLHGTCQKSGGTNMDPDSRALITRTPTKRTPNLQKQPQGPKSKQTRFPLLAPVQGEHHGACCRRDPRPFGPFSQLGLLSVGVHIIRTLLLESELGRPVFLETPIWGSVRTLRLSDNRRPVPCVGRRALAL